MEEKYEVRVLSDIGFPTLYQVVKGFRVVSVHKTKERAEQKRNRLNKKLKK